MYIIIINNYLYIIVSKYVSLVKKTYQILRKHVYIRKEALYNYNKYLPHFYSHGSLVLQTWFVAAICELN